MDAGGLTGSLSFDEQMALYAVLLTHSHYDHIRDIPALGMNCFLRESSVDVYGTEETRQALEGIVVNGGIYPEFMKRPPEKPAIRFHTIKPPQALKIAGYSVLAVPLSNHAVPVSGYLVTAVSGASVFYTGDTGPGLAECWRQVAPKLLIIEVTAPNRFGDFARKTGHLTPALLGEELASFKKINGYLPQVATVHMNPAVEAEIKAELAALAVETGCFITPAYEGMKLNI